MVTLSAKKKVEIRHFTSVLSLRIIETRPDLQWLLRNLERTGLSSGEQTNLRAYLESLGLWRDKGPTPLGEETIQTGRAPVPELGVYELYYIKDFALGIIVIHFERTQAKSRLDEAPEVFQEFSPFEGRKFVSWKADPAVVSFFVEFERQPNEPPRVIRRSDLPAEAELLTDEKGGTRWKVSGSGFAKELPCEDFQLAQNMVRLVKHWDSSLSAQLVDFDEVKTNPVILAEFRRTVRPDGIRHLRFAQGEDPADYTVEVHDVDVLPASIDDAKRWLTTLLREDLTAEAAFVTVDHVEKAEKAILAKSPLRRNHSSLYVTPEEFLTLLEKEGGRGPAPEAEILYWRIRATEGLWSGVPEMASSAGAPLAGGG